MRFWPSPEEGASVFDCTSRGERPFSASAVRGSVRGGSWRVWASSQPLALHMTNSEKSSILEESKPSQVTTWPRWLRMPAAVAYSGISRSAIYELLGAGKIQSHRIGASRVIDRESLDAFITSQPA